MSHIVEAKTAIKNPDRTLLGRAVELVAQQHNGGIQKTYMDFSRREHKVDLALVTSQMWRGMGLLINKEGELVFKGDPYGVEELYERIQQEIIQTYTSLATMQALQALGYTVQAEDGEAGQVILRGVSYA